MDVKSLTINFADGKTATITVGDAQLTFDTPFGKETFAPPPPAPSGSDIMQNVGKYDGTAFDPVSTQAPLFWKNTFAGAGLKDNKWYTWFKADPVNAMDYMQNLLNQQNNSNFIQQFKATLSLNQQREMGLYNG